ncbi:hypothetical protein ACTXT7_010133 [Hymenolepis weldensis]
MGGGIIRVSLESGSRKPSLSSIEVWEQKQSRKLVRIKIKNCQSNLKAEGTLMKFRVALEIGGQ